MKLATNNMGLVVSLLSIGVFTAVFTKLFQINGKIDGNWFNYLSSVLYLRNRRRRNKTNRVITHDVWKDDMRDLGVIPFEHEWNFDGLDMTKSEDLLIYGVNSSKQSIKIEIKSRIDSNRDRNPIKSQISLRFDDNSGNSYTLEDESYVEHKDREYRVCGLGIEILSPFRRKRIRFRGYLTKNGNQLVYVKFRFLWIGLSRVYDFTHDFDDQFMTKEWTKCGKGFTEPAFEDRIEQFGQMKGTFEEDNEPQLELYFWGAITKKYLPNKPVNRKITRIIGYNKKGIGFHLGFLSNANGFEYMFGMIHDRFNFKKIENIGLTKSQVENLPTNPNVMFKVTFDGKEHKFQISKHQDSIANTLSIDDNEGMCYILAENETEVQNMINPRTKPSTDPSLVLSLSEDKCRSVDLSGGKGSSLAELMSLSRQLAEEDYSNKFDVPKGIVVTTNAYHLLLEEYKDLKKEIQELEKLTNLSTEELTTKCDNLVDSVVRHKLPQIIRQEIALKLRKTFGDYENRLFAVRSSAAGEDSEDMSAAGQMTTFLGVRGLEMIFESVMKCWSSQFSLIAVTYKRGYGQTINSPMAVVIQEMVDCESAGVLFTCHPITGDERLIEVTANYGLGESVVSASAEPDTIRLSVHIHSNSLSIRRTISGIVENTIGAKKTLIRLDANGGTREEGIEDRNNCCVSDHVLNRLGDIGLRVHKHYGNARDIEWGVKGEHIFMLQSRPVTNLDNSYTDYEIMHEMDTPHQTEFEIYSRAHWGENFPGSSSWILYSYGMGNKGMMMRMMIAQKTATIEDYNPYVMSMGIIYNQMCFNMTNTSNFFMKMFADYPETDQSRQMVLAMFGHDIDDKDVLNIFKEFREQNNANTSTFGKIKMVGFMFFSLFYGPRLLTKNVNRLIHKLKYNIMDVIGKNHKSSREIFTAIQGEQLRVSSDGMRAHPMVSFGSSIKNGFLRKVLEGAQENNPHLEEDFNLMMSSCNDVISAEVPNSLRAIAKSIGDKERFRQLSDEEALKELRDGTDEASDRFRNLLAKHGHRGYREMDPMYKMWGDDPLPCVRNIKTLLMGSESQLEPKVDKSVDQVISELKTPLSYTRKQLISKVLLPWSRRGVGYRELSKYLMIYINNYTMRKGVWYLAETLVKEGMIPSVEMFFYLTAEEVERLCNGERDPLIHIRARQRKRVYPKMNKYKFEEFVKGPDMRPRNLDENLIPLNLSSGALRMSGTAVSVGSVKARVCVSEDITEAHNIQSGDILITYSTDIGWSPYFPLLSGIITEIGGTISHGAVIAREYGIPCLIAVEGACRAFRTGDVCVLDTNTKTITKVE